MPVLLVPPTQVVPYDAERIVRHRKAMDEFRAGVANLWNASPGEEIKYGAFRRARNYSWSESYDALLQTYFVFPSPSKANDTELARVAVLFRKDTCQMLGSRVIWGANWSSSLPAGVTSADLNSFKSVSSRSFDQRKSPIRLSLETSGYWAPALAWISEAFIGEQMASESMIVHSDLSGLACFRENQQKTPNSAAGKDQKEEKKDAKDTASNLSDAALKRGHRQLKLRLAGIPQKSPIKWPNVSGQMTVFSLPFNSKRKSVEVSKEKQVAYNPITLAGLAREQIQEHLHELKDKTIKVSKREGKFVTVERGIAYGLKIGMHLTGPQGATLHVIRFDSSTQFDDAAILLIRKESSDKPLAAGAVLEIDPKQYPSR